MTKSPVKTLGILGGGQLGRMSAQAAEKLGIRTIIFTPETDSPAAQVSDQTIIADYNDHEALQKFSGIVDVISYEFENVPCETVEYLEKLKPVYPDKTLLEVAQDRIKEKSFLNKIGIATAPWAEVKSVDDITNTLEQWRTDACIIKTVRFGYDGKGQAFYNKDKDLNKIFDGFKGQPLIMEGVVDFECEISIIIARDVNKDVAVYGPVLNEHKNHILDKTFAPAPIDAALAQTARSMAVTLAEEVNLRGVLALELFVTRNGQILANEIAPRTHNSGHWTMDSCEYSQFDNHVRTVCGLPVGSARRHHDAEMINLIGDDVTNIAQYENNPDARIHLYGKTESRPGRKMGHVNILKPLSGLADD